MSKTVLVTGTSSGIGRATAKHFAQQWWNVVATMRSPDRETELTQLENVLVTKLDVTDTDTIHNAVDAANDHFGQIDLLINNAGYGLVWPLETLTDEQIRRQWDVNLYGVIDTMKAVLPQMRERKSGMIINISSIGWSISFPGMAMYMATKWALDGLSENMYYELEQIGVQVKIVKPGAIKTAFAGTSMDMPTKMIDAYAPMMQKLGVKFEEMVPQWSEPELVADMIYTAATDGTNQLRYFAGADADQMEAARQSDGDMARIALSKQMFGL